MTYWIKNDPRHISQSGFFFRHGANGDEALRIIYSLMIE